MKNHRRYLPPLATASAAASAAASALLLATVITPAAKAAPSFSLSDNVGAPTAGSYAPGTSFTLAVTFNTTTASSGYSLWFDTATANAGFFSISQFTLTSASFPDATSNPNTAQSFNTANSGRPGFLSNLNDLGATTTAGTTAAAGSYLVENVTFLIDPSAAAGTYTIQTTPAESGGRASGGSDGRQILILTRPPAPPTRSPSCPSHPPTCCWPAVPSC